MVFFELIETNNQDCNFTETICNSEFTEKANPISKKRYNNLLLCILDNYDLLLSNISNEEKKVAFHKCVMEICSKIEEDVENYYHNFGYNEKIMKSKVIQHGLQCSSKKEIMLSTLLYLNDLYKTHFVIVDTVNKKLYKTGLKKYQVCYVLWNHKFFSLEDKIQKNYTEGTIDECSAISKDLKNTNPYQLFLGPIGKYKMEELKIIATELNIPLKELGKNKVKQVLYNEINTLKLTS